MSAAAVESLPLPPPDKVRVIRRSIRCFMFGMIAVIPCFGLGMVGLAFKLYRDIAAETGERVDLLPLHLSSAAGVLLAEVCVVRDLPNGVLADVIVLLIMQFVFLRRRYLKNAPAEWNPARHLMYWGLGLANAGLILSVVVVLATLYSLRS